MMLLCSKRAGCLEIFGRYLELKPIQPPNIDLNHLLVTEDSLGKRILHRSSYLLRATFDFQRIPGFPSYLNYPDEVPDYSKLIILRGGGIGDLILLLPAIRAFRARLPRNVILTLATFHTLHDLLTGVKDIDEVRCLPLRISEIIGIDYYVEFSRDLDLFRSIHMTDYYLTMMGIPPESVSPSEKKPSLSESIATSQTIFRTFRPLREKWEKIFYVHLGASDIIRRVSHVLVKQLADSFPKVAFVVQSEEHNQDLHPFPNVLFIDTHSSFIDYVSTILCCDGVISSDSSAYHIAASFNKPAIVLFGPIHSSLRALYYPTVTPIDAKYQGLVCRSPCGLNAATEVALLNGRYYDPRKGCPEAQAKGTTLSPCLLSIPFERIEQHLEAIL